MSINELESLHVSLELGKGGAWRAKPVGLKTQNVKLPRTREEVSILPV